MTIRKCYCCGQTIYAQEQIFKDGGKTYCSGECLDKGSNQQQGDDQPEEDLTRQVPLYLQLQLSTSKV